MNTCICEGEKKKNSVYLPNSIQTLDAHICMCIDFTSASEDV